MKCWWRQYIIVHPCYEALGNFGRWVEKLGSAIYSRRRMLSMGCLFGMVQVSDYSRARPVTSELLLHCDIIRNLPLQRYVEAPNFREPGTCPGASQMMPALSKQEELAAVFLFFWKFVAFFKQQKKVQRIVTNRETSTERQDKHVLERRSWILDIFFVVFNSWFYKTLHILSIH